MSSVVGGPAPSSLAAQRAPQAGSTYLGLDDVGSLPRRLTDSGHRVDLSHFAAAPSRWPSWLEPAGLVGDGDPDTDSIHSRDDHPSPVRIELGLAVDGVPAIVLHDYLPRRVNGLPVPAAETFADLDHGGCPGSVELEVAAR